MKFYLCILSLGGFFKIVLFTGTRTVTKTYTPIAGEIYSKQSRIDDPLSQVTGPNKFRGGSGWNKYSGLRRISRNQNDLVYGLCHRRRCRGPECSKGKGPSYYADQLAKNDSARNHHGQVQEGLVLNFRSPQQLQEYLFSQAANAKRILCSEQSYRNKIGHLPTGRLFRRSKGARDRRGNKRNPYRNTRRTWGTIEDLTRSVPPGRKCRYSQESNLSYRTSPHLRRGNAIASLVDTSYDNKKHVPLSHQYNSSPFNFRNRPTYFHEADMTNRQWYGRRAPFFLPEWKLRYPYDRKLYEADFQPSAIGIQKRNQVDTALSSDENIAKLKQMIDELDSMSESNKEPSNSPVKSDKKPEAKNNTTALMDVKDKIDKLLIPLLKKMSNDLNATIATTTAPSKIDADSKKEYNESKKDTENKKEKESESKKGTDTKKESDSKKEYPCKIDGLWVDTNEALELNLTALPNMTVKVSVISDNAKKGIGLNKDCAFNGLTLASFGGPFMLAAVCPEKKKIASFIGQCRSCREEDVIFGLWTFTSGAKDYGDMFTSIETRMDVFRREKGLQLKSEKSPKSQSIHDLPLPENSCEI